MNARALFALLLIVGCSTTKPPPPPPPSPSPSPSPPSSVSPPTSFALRDIPLARTPGKGPIKVEGAYPAALNVSMSDAAQAFGFMHDGKLAYCLFEQCCRDGTSWCRLIDEKGALGELQSPVLFDDHDPQRPGIRKTLAELRDLPKTEGLTQLGPAVNMTQKPPPPKGDLLYGDEITLVVREIAPTTKPDGTITIAGSVRVGGKLAGEEPVFVAFPPTPPFCVAHADVCYEAQLNGLAVSPSGEDLGFVVYIRNPSHGSTFTHLRVTASGFAAGVFNDTGMAHHKKKEWARAAELFTRAVYADPTKEVFAFNLACALARQTDARAEHALHHAIALGGDAVKQRAAADADFAAVRSEPWFVAMTAR